MQIPKNKLHLNNLPEKQSNMERLLRISFAANGHNVISNNSTDGIFWAEDFFSLSGSRLWEDLKAEQRIRILTRMNESLLREAYYIENSGMLYAAKMNLMAESKEERAFFSIMGFEEAQHLQYLTPFFNANITNTDAPGFSKHIGHIITEGDRSTNLFLIQILLEGWGLSYYQELADKSVDPNLSSIFNKILRDEARHHSAGVILLESKQSESNTFLLDAFHELINMVRIGPWTLIQEIKKEMHDISEKHLKQLITDLNAVKMTNQKLAKLKLLTEKSMGADLLKTFEKSGIWKSYTEEEMLKMHL